MLSRRVTVVVFMAFAFAYFLSALIRAITATLSPTLTAEFALNARDLGLLAGGYFLGFAATQLPLGNLLDRFGPKKVILGFLSVAVAGCLAFSVATNFTGLLVARILSGIGVSACLMAPLTGYRRWLSPASQLRANSWMLMTGSMGMVASTLPVQWLMPIWGWRPLFWGLAMLVLLAMAVLAWKAPAWQRDANLEDLAKGGQSYAQVWKHPYFRKLAPLGFFNYGGLLAIQTLWATPWMIRVGGATPEQAAAGLFWINVTMLLTFWTWGLMNPRLVRAGWHSDRLIALGLPMSFISLAIVIAASDALSLWSGVLLALFCMGSSFVSLAQPAVGLAFHPELAGRALSAYNLVIFAGVFAVQWGIGLMIDGLKALGWTEVAAFQGAMGIFLACCAASYVHFLVSKSHNQAAR
jgi:predicted MFS family arabinose efflux permease